MKGKTNLLQQRSDPSDPNSEFYIIIEGCESDPAYWSQVVNHSQIHQILHEARDGVIKVLIEHEPGLRFYLLSIGDLRKALSDRVKKLSQKHPEHAVITLSGVYCDYHDGEIEINRMINFKNQTYPQAGPRPDKPFLPQQIETVKLQTGKSNFIVVDDVCFDGQTTRTLIALGLPVSHIVGGIVTENAYVRLTNRRRVEKGVDPLEQKFRRIIRQKPVKVDRLITVGEHEQMNGQFRDTVPVHDFIPFVPLSGKTLGVEVGDEIWPFYVNGVSFSKPYVLPYLDPQCFAQSSGLSEDKAVAISVQLLINALTLFQRLEEVKGGPITTNDLAYHSPRFSFPFPSEKKPELNFNESVTKVLERDLESLRR